MRRSTLQQNTELEYQLQHDVNNLRDTAIDGLHFTGLLLSAPT